MEIKYVLTKPVLCPHNKRIGDDNIHVQVGSMVCRRCEHRAKEGVKYNKYTHEHTVTCNYGEECKQ